MKITVKIKVPYNLAHQRWWWYVLLVLLVGLIIKHIVDREWLSLGLVIVGMLCGWATRVLLERKGKERK